MMKNILSLFALCCLLFGCYPDPLSPEENEQPEKVEKFIQFDSYRIVGDNNGDGIINKGETVYLRVYLKNIGTSAAKKLKATFSSNSSYISELVPSSSINYGDIAAGSVNNSSGYYEYEYTPNYPYTRYTLRFIVSNTAPAGTQIPVNISITDESGNTWTDSFSTVVEATKAQITYAHHNVVSDNNQDGIINKGETVYLRVYLKNMGTSAAKKLKATFSSNSSYISGFVPTSSINYSDIAAGGVNSSYGYYENEYTPNYPYSRYTFRFTVSNTAPSGTQIPVNMSITDESGNTWTDSFNAMVGSENAEMTYDKYTVVADNNGNRKIEKGETVYLQVFLKNIGSGAANAVKAVFSTGSSYISALSPTTPIDYGNYIGGLQSKYGQGGYDFGTYYTIKFTLSDSAPIGELPISIAITDALNRQWTTSFNVDVE